MPEDDPPTVAELSHVLASVLVELNELSAKLDRLMPLAEMMEQLGDGETSPLRVLAGLMRGGG